MILDTLKQRLRASLVRAEPAGANVVAARRLSDAVRDDGSWPDIDYAAESAVAWDALRHLERTLILARRRHFCDGELDAALTRALDFWLACDFRHTDWRQNQIEVPRLVGSSAFLIDGELSSGARAKVVEILARARWSHWDRGTWTDRTGADLVRLAFNVFLRGCLEDIPALCEEACERVHASVRVAGAGEEGMQADMSFHQHGALLHSGGDGLAYAEICAQFFVVTHGTAWQASTECLRLFASYLLDGQQWMIRRDVFDYSARDHEVTREPGSLWSFVALVEQLADGGIIPRRAEMAAFARRLRGSAEPALQGHRHFWRSDFAVHQRPAFYTSVRMSSRRNAMPGSRNGEGKSSRYLADGLTFILRDGDEYRDVFPVWDGRRLPGTTAVQSPGPPDAERAGRLGAASFVGGVSDGEYGVACMDLAGDALRGRKAWFYFDDCFVCLGSDIACEDGSGPVFTSINQCLLRGPVTAYGKGGETHVLVSGRSYDLSAAFRLEHDGIAYHFPEGMPVRARLAQQTGSRAATGADSAEIVSKEVFSLWIDHGEQPRHESYGYIVLPVDSTDSRAALDHEVAQIKILANTPTLQAVYHPASRLCGIVFWTQGVAAVPGGGRVAVNRPCVVLCQDRRPEGMRLSIANPTNEAATIHVEYANRCLCFDLPGGPNGGRSVTRVL